MDAYHHASDRNHARRSGAAGTCVTMQATEEHQATAPQHIMHGCGVHDNSDIVAGVVHEPPSPRARWHQQPWPPRHQSRHNAPRPRRQPTNAAACSLESPTPKHGDTHPRSRAQCGPTPISKIQNILVAAVGDMRVTLRTSPHAPATPQHPPPSKRNALHASHSRCTSLQHRRAQHTFINFACVSAAVGAPSTGPAAAAAAAAADAPFDFPPPAAAAVDAPAGGIRAPNAGRARDRARRGAAAARSRRPA